MRGKESIPCKVVKGFATTTTRDVRSERRRRRGTHQRV